MQCACAVLSTVACPAVQYFSTLSHKRDDFRKTKLSNIKCIFGLPLRLSDIFLFIGRTQRDMIKNTGRFIMFSVITNIYNKKIKGPTLMELFTATGKLKKFFF